MPKTTTQKTPQKPKSQADSYKILTLLVVLFIAGFLASIASGLLKNKSDKDYKDKYEQLQAEIAKEAKLERLKITENQEGVTNQGFFKSYDKDKQTVVISLVLKTLPTDDAPSKTVYEDQTFNISDQLEIAYTDKTATSLTLNDIQPGAPVSLVRVNTDEFDNLITKLIIDKGE